MARHGELGPSVGSYYVDDVCIGTFVCIVDSAVMFGMGRLVRCPCCPGGFVVVVFYEPMLSFLFDHQRGRKISTGSNYGYRN